MTDIVTPAAGGGIGAVIIVAIQWARASWGSKPNTNGDGNGDKYITRSEYEARHQDVMAYLIRIEKKVDSIHK